MKMDWRRMCSEGIPQQTNLTAKNLYLSLSLVKRKLTSHFFYIPFVPKGKDKKKLFRWGGGRLQSTAPPPSEQFFFSAKLLTVQFKTGHIMKTLDYKQSLFFFRNTGKYTHMKNQGDPSSEAMSRKERGQKGMTAHSL